MNYGKHLRAARELAGLTQEEAARRVGISTQGLGKIERDETGARFSTLTEMAVAYGCQVGDLFPNAGSENAEVLRHLDPCLKKMKGLSREEQLVVARALDEYVDRLILMMHPGEGDELP